MRRWRWTGLGVITAGFVLVIAGALAGQQRSMTGNTWKDLPDDFHFVYAAGFIEGMVVATLQPGPSARIAKCTDAMSYDQIKAVMGKYIADHPEKWHFNLSVLATVAILEACGRPR